MAFIILGKTFSNYKSSTPQQTFLCRVASTNLDSLLPFAADNKKVGYGPSAPVQTTLFQKTRHLRNAFAFCVQIDYSGASFLKHLKPTWPLLDDILARGVLLILTFLKG